MRELQQKRCKYMKKGWNMSSVLDMIRHIHLVHETVFSHFIIDLSIEQFFDEALKEFFVLSEICHWLCTVCDGGTKF